MTPLDIGRRGLTQVLTEWRDAGAPPEDLVIAIEGFIMLKVREMTQSPEGAPFEQRCSFGGDYGWCDLDAGHGGHHRIPAVKSTVVTK